MGAFFSYHFHVASAPVGECSRFWEKRGKMEDVSIGLYKKFPNYSCLLYKKNSETFSVPI